MRILWFEVTPPARYVNSDTIIAGWQDSLETIVKEISGAELFIAFIASPGSIVKTIENVTYIPLHIRFSLIEKFRKKVSWGIDAIKIEEAGRKVIDKYKPDIVQVFGCERPFGLIANKTTIPVVIHIQGSIVSYYNALYPPKYNGYTLLKSAGLNIWQQINNFLQSYRDHSRMIIERKIWKSVTYYMGRTEWDYALTRVMNPSAHYFHVNEALRHIFIDSDLVWKYKEDNKIKIFSTGCSTYWKGIDVMLKTAHVLKEMGIDFEWNVAGSMTDYLRNTVEKKEKLSFTECGINVLGFLNADKMVQFLINSTMMVHTAYIENSPNSICEAQCLGVPIIATYVGGIPTLIRHGIDGELVPANDPWQIAFRIVSLSKDIQRMRNYSEQARKVAIERHSPSLIRKQICECYHEIINNHARK